MNLKCTCSYITYAHIQVKPAQGGRAEISSRKQRPFSIGVKGNFACGSGNETSTLLISIYLSTYLSFQPSIYLFLSLSHALSLSRSLSLALSLSPSLSPSLLLSLSLSLSRSLSLPLFPSLSVSLSVPIPLSICLSIWVDLSVYLSVYLSDVCLSVYLFQRRNFLKTWKLTAPKRRNSPRLPHKIEVDNSKNEAILHDFLQK